MTIEKELRAVSQLSKKQQQTGVSLLIKIFTDVLKSNQNQKPKPINVKAIIKRTNCYNFINILLLAGYYKMNNGKQLKLNVSKLNQLKYVLNEIITYKNILEQSINKQNRKSMSSRQTVKLEYKHKIKKAKIKRIRSRSEISSYKYKPRLPKRLGKYKICNEIGRGAFGTIYKCVDLKLQKYAIKLFNKQHMNKDQMKSVMKEINILSSISPHPNVIKLIEVVENDQYIGIILPYFELGSLYSYIRAYGINEINEIMVKAFITQILRAVEFLHKNNVIHRDIKAANVLINNDGICKVSDFGISMDTNIEAKELDDNNIEDDDDDDVAGSPYWMAPECVEMKHITNALDIWAIGATAIELITGYPPYAKLSPMSALFRVVQDEHPPIPNNISNLFKDFLMDCFYKDPKGRASAAQLLNHKWLKDIQDESF